MLPLPEVKIFKLLDLKFIYSRLIIVQKSSSRNVFYHHDIILSSRKYLFRPTKMYILVFQDNRRSQRIHPTIKYSGHKTKNELSNICKTPAWSEWSNCSKTRCGVKTRFNQCENDHKQTQPCNQNSSCPKSSKIFP